MQRFTSAPIRVPQHEQPYYRADIELEGIERFGSSYVGLVFLNRTDATEATELTLANGYANRFTVFGHPICIGGAGHCDVRAPESPFDRSPEHPLTPVNVTVEITEALRAVTEQEMTVTILVFSSSEADAERDDVLRFARLSLITYE